VFKREDLEVLFDQLGRTWRGKPEYEQLLRDAHLGIALHDAGRPLVDEVDERVASLIEKHGPRE